MLKNPESDEAIDSIKLSMDEKFESEVSQLPLVTRAPARAIYSDYSHSSYCHNSLFV